ncbi:DUF3122 domain-containing protein [Leptolyngbya sp. 7M]|uniref:DUF3122 domain-containing protein n=1 Tax=Leptolyngbya sp. 7M TaxID=2812896 RepID=UPI002939067E|nr:DUF3122 domain-containing protein [Leptolyngbya sp. 7M]
MIKTKRFWLAQIWLSLGLVLFLGLVYSPAAAATVLYTADTSGAVIVQSRRTLRDQDRHSWQVIGFKQIQADGREGGMALRLVGFPGAIEIDHAQPITFTDPKGHTLLVHDISNQIGKDVPLQPHVGYSETDRPATAKTARHPETDADAQPAIAADHAKPEWVRFRWGDTRHRLDRMASQRVARCLAPKRCGDECRPVLVQPPESRPHRR